MLYTSIEQSKKLLELGLNPETADMFWQSNLNSSDRQYLLDMGEEEYFDIEMNFEHCDIGDYDIPAWSVDALLQLILPSKSSKTFHLLLEDSSYCIAYNDSSNGEYEEFVGATAVEAAFYTVCYLLENDYIKIEK